MSTAAKAHSEVDHTRAKLFSAVRDGAILHIDKQKKEAYLDQQGAANELVPYAAAARWVDHLDTMARQACTDSDRGAAPSTELSRIVVTTADGSRELLSQRHPTLP